MSGPIHVHSKGWCTQQFLRQPIKPAVPKPTFELVELSRGRGNDGNRGDGGGGVFRVGDGAEYMHEFHRKQKMLLAAGESERASERRRRRHRHVFDRNNSCLNASEHTH